jgi:glycosyltransferase involved in cell wall biosynthesis
LSALPRITVITVCRNRLPALRRTVASVLAQDYPALEYWIVDGASSDGTREYLDELGARGVRTLSEPDQGIADAMNKGVRLASGEWVAHLHADDEYLTGTLAAVAHHAAAGDADVLCGWLVKRERTGEVVYHCDPSRLPAEMTINHPATFVRRELFERLGGFETTFPNAMDYEFFLHLHAAGARFRVIPASLARMAYGGQSERSAWRTQRESRDIRRRHSTSAWHRSQAFFLFLVVRLKTREWLQSVGLGGLVARYRRHLATLKKS